MSGETFDSIGLAATVREAPGLMASLPPVAGTAPPAHAPTKAVPQGGEAPTKAESKLDPEG